MTKLSKVLLRIQRHHSAFSSLTMLWTRKGLEHITSHGEVTDMPNPLYLQQAFWKIKNEGAGHITWGLQDTLFNNLTSTFNALPK